MASTLSKVCVSKLHNVPLAHPETSLRKIIIKLLLMLIDLG